MVSVKPVKFSSSEALRPARADAHFAFDVSERGLNAVGFVGDAGLAVANLDAVLQGRTLVPEPPNSLRAPGCQITAWSSEPANKYQRD